MPEVLDRAMLEALSVDTRQGILKLLASRPYTATELAKALKRHVTTVSEHLDVLERAGLVVRRDDGHKWIYYILAPRGERLFKPQICSWIVVFSVSLVSLFVGIWECAGGLSKAFGPPAIEGMYAEAAKIGIGPKIAVPVELWLGLGLVSVAMFGFGYLVGRFRRLRQLAC